MEEEVYINFPLKKSLRDTVRIVAELRGQMIKDYMAEIISERLAKDLPRSLKAVSQTVEARAEKA